MIYEFIHEPTGEIVEIHFPAKEAPSIGEEIMHAGRVVRRIVSRSMQVNTHPNTGKYPYVSNALPTTIADDGDCRLVREKPGGRLKPLVESKAHEQRLMSKYDLVKGL